MLSVLSVTIFGSNYIYIYMYMALGTSEHIYGSGYSTCGLASISQTRVVPIQSALDGSGRPRVIWLWLDIECIYCTYTALVGLVGDTDRCNFDLIKNRKHVQLEET